MLKKASAGGLGTHLERLLGSLLVSLTQAGEVGQKVNDKKLCRCQNVVLANIKIMQIAQDIFEKLKMRWNGHKHGKIVQEVS